MEDVRDEDLVDKVATVEVKEPEIKTKKNKAKGASVDVPKIISIAPVEVSVPELLVQETNFVDKQAVIPEIIEQFETENISSISAPPQETVIEIVDEFLSSNKPWYLSSSHIYVLVKNAVASIPYSQNIFDKTLLAICTTTGYINKSTNLNVVLESQDCYELVAKLDETVSSLLVRADDGFDTLREKLGVSLQELSGAISTHTVWAEQFTKQSVSDLSDSSAEVVVAMKTRYEKTVDLIRIALALAKDHVTTAASSVKDSATGYVSDTYNSSVDAAKSAVAGVQTRVDSTVMSALVGALKTAQPYVHSAVTTSTPYLVQAVEASQPYVARAMPYIDPLVARASDINAALSEHQVVGPYVTLAEETAVKVLEGAKTYCTPEVKA